jgi:periplasmic protein TonB
MLLARTIAVTLSLLVHGAIGYVLMPKELRSEQMALQTGVGDDIINVEQGIAIEGLAKLGEAMETIQTQEVAAIDPTPPPPVEEIKPIEELTDAITSEASTVEDEIVKTEDPPPEELKEEQPPEVQALAQPEQLAIVTEQSSGQARDAGDAVAFGLYLGKINEKVQRAKVNPRTRISGTVVMRFTVGLDGELLSKEVATSSGSDVLDQAAIAALERAAPFPPIPPEVSSRPLAFTQPFRFITR